MQKEVARILLDTQAVKLSPESPFTWSSGWRSPIYCDNRTVLSFVDERSRIKLALARRISEAFPEVTALVGVATAGIAMGAMLADELGLSYAYCRPKPKEHGLQRQLEGRVEPGAKLVVIEDLISTGGSSLKVVEYLRAEGYEVLGLAAIFSYGFELAADNFKAANCPYVVLSDYDALIQEALERGVVSANEMDALHSWRLDPANW